MRKGLGLCLPSSVLRKSALHHLSPSLSKTTTKTGRRKPTSPNFWLRVPGETVREAVPGETVREAVVFGKVAAQAGSAETSRMASFVACRGRSSRERKSQRRVNDVQERSVHWRSVYIVAKFLSFAGFGRQEGTLAVSLYPRRGYALGGKRRVGEVDGTSAEWFVFGDKNPGERVEHESETSVVFAKLRTPERGEFELP